MDSMKNLSTDILKMFKLKCWEKVMCIHPSHSAAMGKMCSSFSLNSSPFLQRQSLKTDVLELSMVVHPFHLIVLNGYKVVA